MKHRIIPALLLDNRKLVKTQKFKKPKYVGDPINAIRIFNDKEVDELMVLDISATKENLEPDYSMIEQFAGECFMPLAYGGGIRSLQQAKKIFALGVEKICIQTEALINPRLVKDLANEFGSQSIMVSIDIKRNWFGKAKVYCASQNKSFPINWLKLIKDLVNIGAGEVLLNSVDRDGTLSGPDLNLIKQASSCVNVPLIALGGISSLEDIKEAINVGASAVAAGAFFVYQGPHRAVLITYPKYDELRKLFDKD